MEDKDRISEIMRHKGMVAKNFCEATGISPASLSHILNGKAKASLPVLRSIVDAFPELNPIWVLLGKGEMLSNPDDYVGKKNDYLQVLVLANNIIKQMLYLLGIEIPTAM